MGASTPERAAHATTRAVRSTASTRCPAPRAPARASFRRQGLAQQHLGPLGLRNRREQVSVARQPQQRALFAPRRRRDARRLLDRARDHGGEQPRTELRAARVADGDRQAPDEGARPLEAEQIARAGQAQRGRREHLAHRAVHLGVARAAHHHARQAGRELGGERGTAQRPQAAHGGLVTDDVGDRLHGIAHQAAHAVDHEVPATQVRPQRPRHLARDARRHREHDEPRPLADLGLAARQRHARRQVLRARPTRQEHRGAARARRCRRQGHAPRSSADDRDAGTRHGGRL